jgi:anthranilate phosphoribosyltransferase
MIKEAIGELVKGNHLSREVMTKVMNQIMSGEATEAQIGSFLTALRLKGETVEEITGAAVVMREKAVKIQAPGECIDTCGTGGDHSLTINISTGAALVAAAAGLVVAKHGNRAASSACGSADVLKALGVNIEAEPRVVERCLAEVGIGFLFAPLMHGAMRYAIGPRREIGIRTVFNLLGPLTNPAGAGRQLLGVFDGNLTEALAMVLHSLGSQAALVVHGLDGLDEITLTGQTRVSELKDGRIKNYTVCPEDFGLKPCKLDALRGGDPEHNARILREVLADTPGPARDAVALNAGAAIYVGGKAPSLAEGVKQAQAALAAGQAKKKLEHLIQVSRTPWPV